MEGCSEDMEGGDPDVAADCFLALYPLLRSRGKYAYLRVPLLM